MTSRNGGRIPNQGRGPQAKGVGRRAKRHDLERPTTPGLADSDLQQGDVGMLEQGQRTAPIRRQADAIPPPQSGASLGRNRGGARSGGPGPALDDQMGVIKQTIGGTAAPGPQGLSSASPDLGKRTRAQAWIGFHQQLAQHPASSPLYRARTMQQVRDTIDAQSFSPAVGGALFMRDTDDALEMMARGDLRRE